MPDFSPRPLNRMSSRLSVSQAHALAAQVLSPHLAQKPKYVPKPHNFKNKDRCPTCLFNLPFCTCTKLTLT